MTLDQKLLAICNISYLPQYAGQFSAQTPFDEAAGFLEPPFVVSGGDFGINSAIIGKIAEGTVICYRGTLSFDDQAKPQPARVLDWVQDFHAELVTAGGLPGRCHEGFVAAIDSLDSQIEALAGDGVRIYVGHSKGGGCAVLAALRHCRASGRPAKCLTFGSPRAGNADFAAAFEDSGVFLMRVEAAADVVPHVPFEPRVAEILEKSFGVSLPEADYRPVGNLRFIERDGGDKRPAGPLACAAVEMESLFDMGATFASGGFKAIRNAHDISVGSLYWRGVFGIAPEVHQ